MGIEKEYPGHPDLTSGGEITLHSHAGGGGGKEMDAGTHALAVSKTFEAVAFHITFTAVPAVVVTLMGIAGGKKSGAGNVTTTGFDITGEAVADHDWIAMEKG